MKAASIKTGIKTSQAKKKRIVLKGNNEKVEKIREEELCRVIPPLVALIPELLDMKVPKNYTPQQAIELLELKIRNRLLL